MLSRQRGGQIAWIPKAFTRGGTADVLSRTLSEDEINTVDHDHGFRLSQVHDGREVGMGAGSAQRRKERTGRIRRTPFATSKTSILASGKPVKRGELLVLPHRRGIDHRVEQALLPRHCHPRGCCIAVRVDGRKIGVLL